LAKSNFASEKDSNGFVFQAIVLVLSSYIGLFFAYIIQQSSAVFSHSVELTTYISAYRLNEYDSMAYSLIEKCYGFSDQNLFIVIFGLTTFALLIVLLRFVKTSFSAPRNVSKILLGAIALVSIIVWFIEPLVVVFSSLESPNVAYLIAKGRIPDSDVAALGRTIVLLDRFQLFSKAFFFSFRIMAFATFALLSSLSLSKLANNRLSRWKKNLMLTFSISPLFVLLLFWIFSPSTAYYFPGGEAEDSGPLWLEGLGAIYPGLIIRPFLERLQSVLLWLLCGLWGIIFLSGIIFESEEDKNQIMKVLDRLKSFFKR